MALMSCSKSDDGAVMTSDGEVRIASSIATRTVGNTWESGDEIGVYMTTNGANPYVYGDLDENILYTTTSNSLGNFTSNTPIYYPALGTVDFLAYYPYSDAEGFDVTAYPVDVTTQTDQGAIDLMVATVTNQAKTTNTVDMTFDHKLSNIVLNVVNGDGYDNLKEVGAISTIELSGSITTAEYNLTDDTIALGSDTDTIEFVVTQSDEAITAEAIVIPQTLLDSSAILTVTTAAGAVHTVALNGTFAICTQYRYKLNLNLTELTISGTTINDWNKIDGGELEGTLPDPVWDGKYPDSIEAAIDLVGSADANGFYQIKGEEEFAAIAYLVKNDYSNYKNANIVLNRDLDLGREEWTPIGSSDSYPFTGSFDGGCYEVSGLYIESSSENQALFGYISDATITNVSVSGSVVSSERYVAGVVGYAVQSTITNCNNSATVSGSSDHIGGIVGYLDSSSTITHCNNSGAITSSQGGSIGGIAGSSSFIVKNCYNAGVITATGTDYRNIGGIVGHSGSSSYIISSYNSGAIIASGTTNNSIGGVAGQNNSATIVNCYNTGSVSGGTNAGGVVGLNNNSGITTNCYNIGNVSGGATSANGVVGSIVGGDITDCYYLETTTSDNNATSMTLSDMQAESFVTTLNTNAYNYNQTALAVAACCAWVYNEGDYPSLDFDGVPAAN